MGFLKTVKKAFHLHFQGNCFLFVFAFNLKEFTPYDCVAGARHAYELISFLSRLIHECVALSLSRVWLFSTPRATARQAPLPFTVSSILLKFMSIKSVMPSNHLTLCPLLFLPSIFPSIRVFSNELSLLLIIMYMHISNTQNWTWNNRLVPNRKRCTSRLYIVTLLI